MFLDNVSKSRQILGYHRDSFYEIKRAFHTAALVEQRRDRETRAARENRVSGKSRACTNLSQAHRNTFVRRP